MRIGLPALQFLFVVILLGLLMYNVIAEVQDGDPLERIHDDAEKPLKDKQAAIPWNHFYIFGLALLATTLVLAAQLRITPYKGTLAPSLMTLITLAVVVVGGHFYDTPRSSDVAVQLDRFQATISFVAALLLTLVSYLVFLFTLTDKQVRPGSVGSYALLITAGLVLAGTLFHNYFIGPHTGGDHGQYIVPINLESQDVAIVLIGNFILLMGVAHYLLRVIGINDMEEVRYFSFIVAGLGAQYLVLIINFVRNGSDLVFQLADLIATFMAAALIILGVSLFYLKRRTSRSFETTGYFGLLVAGIFSLLLFLIIPILLSGQELNITRDDWPTLSMSLIMALAGLYMLLQYARRELGSRLDDLKSRSAAEAQGAGSPPEEQMSLDEAFETILDKFPESTIDMQPDEPKAGGPGGLDWEGVKNFMDDQTDDEDFMEAAEMELAGEVRAPIKLSYKVEFPKITQVFSIFPDTVHQMVTHLKSGKNIMLYGEPGTGKTKLSTLLLTQICGTTTNSKGQEVPNFTIVTANAEWSNFEVIGGIAPDDKGGYYFKDGYVAEAAKRCERSIKETRRPHYLVIDEFNRANIDEAFGKLFTVFEYRDKQPLLTAKENRGQPFMMPPEFRIIGTMNTKDKNTLFNVGHALMRRFSFIEIPLPDKQEEFQRMPEFVWDHMEKLGSAPELQAGTQEQDWFSKEMFDFYDEDKSIYNTYVKLMGFMEEEEEPGRDEEVPRGVRTYRKIGPAALIDSMVTLVNARGQYSMEKALEDVIHANIMPSMEGMEKPELRCIRLKALEILGPNSAVTHTLERMIESPSLSMFG